MQLFHETLNLFKSNTYPSSLVNIAIGGLRQLLAFLLHFPRPEPCGAYLELGPSTSHPLRELEATVQAKQLRDPDNRAMGQDGQKYLLRVELKAKGDTDMETRNIKLNAGYGRSVTGLKSSVRLQLGLSENRFLELDHNDDDDDDDKQVPGAA